MLFLNSLQQLRHPQRCWCMYKQCCITGRGRLDNIHQVTLGPVRNSDLSQRHLSTGHPLDEGWVLSPKNCLSLMNMWCDRRVEPPLRPMTMRPGTVLLEDIVDTYIVDRCCKEGKLTMQRTSYSSQAGQLSRSLVTVQTVSKVGEEYGWREMRKRKHGPLCQ